jgi:pimeloyl-ACP methyl ester carboxylesterase/class 3 adenylate cyclase
MQPDTKYAKSGGVNIAYQTVGERNVDLVFVPGWVSHIESAWEEPSFAPFLERLASFSRLILLDRRGTGLSDPVDRLPTLEERMDDICAVMDAAGSPRAFLFGISEGGPMCTLLAATYPERTAGLVLCNTFARNVYAHDYPWGLTVEQWNEGLKQVEAAWGTGITAQIFAPSRAADEAFRRSWGRFERRAVSPGAMHKIVRMAMDTDVRHILPSIRVPTLVVHRVGDEATRIEGGRYLAQHIPGAKLVEVSGIDHFPWVGDTDAILDEVEHFVTGTRRGAELDRILATVLFTDIVGSTERAAELGDRRWRSLLESHHRLVRTELGRHRGREIDSAGDSFLATFDGPARGIRCAHAITAGVRQLGIDVRAGLHTGECEVMGDTIGGIAVHIGARVAAAAAAGEVLVSSIVKDLVAGSGIQFADRGTHVLKGVPGEWRLFAASI